MAAHNLVELERMDRPFTASRCFTVAQNSQPVHFILANAQTSLKMNALLKPQH